VAGFSENSEEPLIKGREFLDQLSDYQLFRKDSSVWS
jgi:hypothetical protein